MYHINEWFVTEPKEGSPLCHPTYPSTCKRRFKRLKKQQSSDYAQTLAILCRKCLEKTKGEYKHVNRLNRLLDLHLSPVTV